MKVLFLDSPLIISVIPRSYDIGLGVLSVFLRDEMTDSVIVPEITHSIGRTLNITIVNQPIEFKTQQKYELLITYDDDVLYSGKLLILEKDTDIQNYTYGSQNTARFDFKK